MNKKEYFKFLEGVVKDYSATKFSSFLKDAEKDGKDFLKASRERLAGWAKLVASGDMSREDFDWLAGSLIDLAKLEALRKAGALQVKLERYAIGLVEMVVQATLKFIAL